MAIFASITSILLVSISQSRKQQAEDLQQQELLAVAKMAVQTHQNQLTLNGVTVQVERTTQHISVYHQGKEVLHVDKN